ncbi:MAG: hypothetical protein HY943_03920 [Gammaproteobacteria bacterium]|nr:hypothetical protein [Gammaproteobacteria bacterium]
MPNCAFAIMKNLSRAVAALCLAAGCLPAHADLAWSGADGAWDDASQWSSGSVPTAADFVRIDYIGAVTLAGPADAAKELTSHAALSQHGGHFQVVGTADLFGSYDLGGTAQADVGRIYVQAAGRLGLTGSGASLAVVEGIFSSGEFAVDAGATVGAESIDNYAHMSVDGASVSANSMINHPAAALTVSGAGGQLTINGALTNQGSVTASDAGRIAVHSLDNHASVEVNAGRFEFVSMKNFGTLAVQQAGGALVGTDNLTNGGTLTVGNGAEAALDTIDNDGEFVASGNAAVSLVSMDNRASGVVRLLDTATFSSVDSIVNRGRFTAAAGTQVSVGQFQQFAGTTALGGGRFETTNGRGLILAGGTLEGRGDITGLLKTEAGATLTPGDAGAPVGTFAIAGDLVLGGLFDVQLAGLGGTAIDHLTATGHATLGGTLAVSLLGGFDPLAGDAFDLITANGFDGAFAQVLLPALGGGRRFELGIAGNVLRLKVAAVPLPATALPFLLGGLATILGARRRVCA